jgi:hypothetical protein
MRDALIVALKEEATDADGQMTTKLRMVARKLVDRAMDGDVPAIKEVGDRVDGKPPQAIIGDSDEDPINMLHRIENIIVDPQKRGSEGVPSSAEPE